ncbi:MAG: DUF58 domain-containing protein [Clostridiales bacterium]|nr:DUF58 domain-containing protein [Clostridiales bacterium]
MNVAAMAVLFLCCLFLQSLVMRKFAFSKLEYGCSFTSGEAFEGDSLYLVETVYNGKAMPVLWLKVDIHSSRWLDFAGSHSVIAQEGRRVTSSFLLKPWQKTTRKWKVKCLKRGIFNIENVTLASGDMLNFNIVSKAERVGAELVVYPGTVDIGSLFVPVNYLQSEFIVNRWLVEDPFIVAGTREYSGLEPVNRIHWPATAKTGALMVRKNEFTSQTSLLVLLNLQSTPDEYIHVVDRNKAEFGIKVASTLIDEAMREGLPVRLGTNGCVQPDNMLLSEAAASGHEAQGFILTGEAGGSGHGMALLKLLSALELKTSRGVELLMEEISGKVENSSIFLITAFLNNNICNNAKLLEMAGNSVTILLLDKLPENGQSVAETTCGLDIRMLSAAFLKNGEAAA